MATDPTAPPPGQPPLPEVLGPEAMADEPESPAGKRSPLRRCVASGRVREKDRMVRFVISPEGAVVPDVEETLPGRGLWLTADPAMVEKALSKGLFSKAARRAVKADPGLLATVRQLVRRRALELVGLARKGGGAIAGFEKVQASLRSGQMGRPGAGAKPVGIWLEARDGSADGRAKLRPLALARQVPLVDRFDRAELGPALGREDAVHAVLAAGPLAQRLLREVDRMAALEGMGPVAQGPDEGSDFG